METPDWIKETTGDFNFDLESFWRKPPERQREVIMRIGAGAQERQDFIRENLNLPITKRNLVGGELAILLLWPEQLLRPLLEKTSNQNVNLSELQQTLYTELQASPYKGAFTLSTFQFATTCAAFYQQGARCYQLANELVEVLLRTDIGDKLTCEQFISPERGTIYMSFGDTYPATPFNVQIAGESGKAELSPFEGLFITAGAVIDLTNPLDLIRAGQDGLISRINALNLAGCKRVRDYSFVICSAASDSEIPNNVGFQTLHLWVPVDEYASEYTVVELVEAHLADWNSRFKNFQQTQDGLFELIVSALLYTNSAEIRRSVRNATELVDRIKRTSSKKRSKLERQLRKAVDVIEIGAEFRTQVSENKAEKTHGRKRPHARRGHLRLIERKDGRFDLIPIPPTFIHRESQQEHTQPKLKRVT